MVNYIDLAGKKVGRLTVLSKDRPHITSGGGYVTKWICQCDCGKMKSVSSQKLRNGSTISCGCHRNEKIKAVNYEDLSGLKFEKLTVIRYLAIEERKTRGYNWLCQCECGKFVHSNASKLKQGHTKSCGCLVAEHIGQVNRKYKNVDKRLYRVYQGMLARCYDKRSSRYKDYGGRGITVSDIWLGEYGYDVFSNWAYSHGYSSAAEHGDCTLDRKNVNGDYEPENCRWITNKEQQNNRRNCHYVQHNGKSQTIAEWAEELNISYACAYWHLAKQNRTVQELMDFKQKTKK